jgi:hypothetical protein
VGRLRVDVDVRPIEQRRHGDPAPDAAPALAAGAQELLLDALEGSVVDRATDHRPVREPAQAHRGPRRGLRIAAALVSAHDRP